VLYYSNCPDADAVEDNDDMLVVMVMVMMMLEQVLPAARPSAIWLQASTSLPAKTSSSLIGE
jgi:hypothetical protein